MKTATSKNAAKRVYAFDLAWIAAPAAFLLAFTMIYDRATPTIENSDVALLVFEGALFIFIASFVLGCRKKQAAGWVRAFGVSWILVSTPLWLAVISPLPLALETLESGTAKLPVWILLSLLVAINEETIFRGFLLKGSAQSLGPMAALIISSLLFGAFHALNAGEDAAPRFVAAQMVSAAGMGSIAAAMTLRSGSIAPAVALHALGDMVGLAALNGYEDAMQSVEYAPSMAVSGILFFVWGVFWTWRAQRTARVRLPGLSNAVAAPKS